MYQDIIWPCSCCEMVNLGGRYNSCISSGDAFVDIMNSLDSDGSQPRVFVFFSFVPLN